MWHGVKYFVSNFGSHSSSSWSQQFRFRDFSHFCSNLGALDEKNEGKTQNCIRPRREKKWQRFLHFYSNFCEAEQLVFFSLRVLCLHLPVHSLGRNARADTEQLIELRRVGSSEKRIRSGWIWTHDSVSYWTTLEGKIWRNQEFVVAGFEPMTP